VNLLFFLFFLWHWQTQFLLPFLSFTLADSISHVFSFFLFCVGDLRSGRCSICEKGLSKILHPPSGGYRGDIDDSTPDLYRPHVHNFHEDDFEGLLTISILNLTVMLRWPRLLITYTHCVMAISSCVHYLRVKTHGHEVSWNNLYVCWLYQQICYRKCI